MIRVVVVDDQSLVRTGFRMILESSGGIEVVGEAGDGSEAIAVVAATTPDVVLMDVRMPGLDGIAATRQILHGVDDVRCRVIILTTFDLDEYVYAALRAGASGFLLKDTPADELIRAVQVVNGGDALLAPSVTRRLILDFSSRPSHQRPAPGLLDQLTEREREVLAHIARGLSNAEIAAALFVSETTVKTHVSAVLMKLGLRDRVQAVVVAYESGLVGTSGGVPQTNEAKDPPPG